MYSVPFSIKWWGLGEILEATVKSPAPAVYCWEGNNGLDCLPSSKFYVSAPHKEGVFSSPVAIVNKLSKMGFSGPKIYVLATLAADSRGKIPWFYQFLDNIPIFWFETLHHITFFLFLLSSVTLPSSPCFQIFPCLLLTRMCMVTFRVNLDNWGYISILNSVTSANFLLSY